MPQSVFFSDDEEGQTELQKSQRVYSLAQNLTIFERDEISYSYPKKLFPSVNHILAPDTVTSLDCSGINYVYIKVYGIDWSHLGDFGVVSVAHISGRCIAFLMTMAICYLAVKAIHLVGNKAVKI